MNRYVSIPYLILFLLLLSSSAFSFECLEKHGDDKINELVQYYDSYDLPYFNIDIAVPKIHGGYPISSIQLRSGLTESQRSSGIQPAILYAPVAWRSEGEYAVVGLVISAEYKGTILIVQYGECGPNHTVEIKHNKSKQPERF